MPPAQQSGQWILAGRLFGLIMDSRHGSLRQAAAAIGIEYTVLWHAVHGRQPMQRTLKRILDGLDASEADLLDAPDVPFERRESIRDLKAKIE